MNKLLNKGRFEKVNDLFIKESMTALSGLTKIQKKYQKGDMDTLLNELHDSIVAKYLGFKLVNIEKHGFDCKLDYDKPVFLESKVASYTSKSWNATFNDTTFEKAEAFRLPNVWLALSIWTNVTDILCICYGQNSQIGDILENGVKKHQDGKTVRSTQSISFTKLVFEMDFKILSPVLPKCELLKYLNLFVSNKLNPDKIVEFKDFISYDQ